MQSGRSMPGLGSFRFATGLVMCWHLEFAIGRPTPVNGHRVYEVLPKMPQLAHGFQTCTSMMLPAFINDDRSSPFFSHNKPTNSTAGESSTSELSTYTVGSSVDSALRLAAVMVDSLGFQMESASACDLEALDL